MPSFKVVLFALAALSSSVIARPNHADKWGYPHGQDRIPGAPAKPMTPGGYIDERPNNQGSVCTKDKQCSNPVPLAVGFCAKPQGSRTGKCSFTCLGTTVKRGNKCIGQWNAPKCHIDANCPRNTSPNGYAACVDGVCRLACHDDFHLNTSGAKCVPNKTTCGDEGTAPHVAGGFAACKKGHWKPSCNAYPGGRPYEVSPGSYKCIKTNSDPKNCGSRGHVCQGGYNGLGSPVCLSGHCSLDCHGLRVRSMNGRKYCAAM